MLILLILITFDRQDQTHKQMPCKIVQECKPLCDHFCLNSFCLHLPISFMNMEGVSSILVFICGLFLTQNASCWCSENLNKGVTSHGCRHTHTPLWRKPHHTCMFKSDIDYTRCSVIQADLHVVKRFWMVNLNSDMMAEKQKFYDTTHILL